MSNDSSRALPILMAVLIMALVTAHQTVVGRAEWLSGDLTNPDAYFNMVVLLDGWAADVFPFVARDNAPFGAWMHWTLPYSWTLWQAHLPLQALGMTPQDAMRYAGGALTLLSMLLLTLLLSWTVLRISGRSAAIVAGMMLATSIPLLSYGSALQITHHVFMLLPLAAAAGLLLTCRDDGIGAALAGGAMLGLALWISPETMPFVVGLAYVRIALHLETAPLAPLWPVAMGLASMTALAYAVDPPPPTFDAWALDRISLAYLLLAGLLATMMIAAQMLAARSRRWPVRLWPLAALSMAAVLIWVLAVPGVLAGPSGLVPEELKVLWWRNVRELQPALTPARLLAWSSLPLCGAAVAAYAAWRQRSLWLAALAFMALAYGVLGVWHVRMGVPSTLAAVLAFGAGVGGLAAFRGDDRGLSQRQRAVGLLLTVYGPMQLVAFVILIDRFPEPDLTPPDKACNLLPIAGALQQLPAATFLAELSRGPELLYRSHHRVVAGPYHHDVEGMLDNYRAWGDRSAEGSVALAIIRRRQVGYVLGCSDFQRELGGRGGPRSLAQRVADGDVPDWLQPMTWPPGVQSRQRLYRVRVPAASGAPAAR